MARQTPEQNEQHRVELAFYKWEFLRRNRDYERDYNDLMKRHSKVLRRAGYPTIKRASLLDADLSRKLGVLHYKWGVGFMQNPKRQVPLPLMRQKRRRAQNPFWEAHQFSVLSDTAIVNWDTVRFKNLAVDFRRNWEWFPIAINLEARPQTLHRQLEALLKKIRARRFPAATTPSLETGERVHSRQQVWQNLARKGVLLPGSQSKPIRLDAASFDAYLKAWNLKREGCSMTEIVKGLHLISAGEHPRQDHLQRAHRSIVQAVKLISGAYRRIS